VTENAVRDRYFFYDYILSYLFSQFEAELNRKNVFTFDTAKLVIWTFATPFIFRKADNIFAVSALRMNAVSSEVYSTDLAFLCFRNL